MGHKVLDVDCVTRFSALVEGLMVIRAEAPDERAKYEVERVIRLCN